MGLTIHTITKFPDAKGRQKMAVTRKDAELSFRARSNDFVYLLAQQLLLRRHYFQ
jgi:hypothetical protein